MAVLSVRGKLPYFNAPPERAATASAAEDFSKDFGAMPKQKMKAIRVTAEFIDEDSKKATESEELGDNDDDESADDNVDEDYEATEVVYRP